MRKIEVLILTFLVLVSINVSAIGVSPGKIIKYYQPGETGQIEFYAVNSKNAETPIEFGSFGELSNEIKINAEQDVLKPGEAKLYSFEYTIPGNLLPGDHRTDVTITETREDNNQAGTIGATASVGLIFIVRVPYDGEYLSADLSAGDVNFGETVNFNVKLNSLGKERVDSAAGVLKIYDSNKNLVGVVDFPETSIDPGEVKEINMPWNSGNNPEGSYSAELELNYAGKTANADVKFRIGVLNIEIEGIVQKELEVGKINKIDIITKNMGASTISGVYGEVNFLGKTVRTADLTYSSWEEKTVVSYADATEISPGEYILKVKLHYSDQLVEKDFIIKAVNSTNFSLIATISGIIALIIAMIILYLFRHNRNKREKKRK